MGAETVGVAGWELRRLIAHMDFAIVGFCRVKEVKPFPVVASGEKSKWANNLDS